MLRPWKMIIAERINPALDAPLYLQIAHALIHEIERGRLVPGTFLPSSRELATLLGVNRKTVVLAYEDLGAQGWLTTQGTKGTAVSTTLPNAVPRADAERRPVQTPAFLFRDGGAPAFVRGSQSDLRLDEGSPDCRLFPAELLTRAYRTAIQRARRGNDFRYEDPRGSPRLRQQIAAMLTTQRGLVVDADNICITRGSQMAITCTARALLRTGDHVAVEALSYPPAAQAIRAAGGKVAAVALDQGGIDVSAVERLCRREAVRAVYLTPHHQFPTTVALRPERRLQLVDLARQYGFAIIEDDYDHEYHFASQPLLPIASYAPDLTIYIGSLSKLLLPTLRIGYIAAPSSVIDVLAGEIMTIDRQGNRLTEDAVAELIELGEVRRHVRKTSLIYAQRRQDFAALLRARLGDIAQFDVPDGGLAFWLRFHDEALLDRIDRQASREGLRIAPSHYFALDPDGGRGLRLGFASLDAAEADIALGKLRAAAGLPAG